MAAESNEIRRVLFCVADQWRYDALGALGTAGVRTPHLDALAADGVLFGNHWCQASPCGPSRSSLLTGTHASTHRQWTNDDSADHGLPTLAAILRSAGVTPTLIGYTDTPQPRNPGRVDEVDPLGADLLDPEFDVELAFLWQLGFPTWRAELQARGYDLDPDAPFGLYAPDPSHDTSGLAPAHYRAEDSDVAFLTDAAVDVFGRWPERSLLHLNWLRPHPPMTPPRPYHRLVDPDEVGLPVRPLTIAEEADRHPYFRAMIAERSMTEYLQQRRPVESVTERDDRNLRAAYFGLCAEVDAHVGRLVAELQRLDLYDSTLIVFTSDHGDALGDHWIYGRQGPFDGHFRVPCIIRDPRPAADATRGSRTEALTANIDLLPTILDGLGIEIPPSVEGRSLQGWLQGSGAGQWREHVRYDMDWDDHLRSDNRRWLGLGPGRSRFNAIRTSQYRLVRFPALPPMLFDVIEDPTETIDLAADPGHRAILDDLSALS